VVDPHYRPQSGMQVWQSREDGANLDPCSEDDEKPRHRVTVEGRHLTVMMQPQQAVQSREPLP